MEKSNRLLLLIILLLLLSACGSQSDAEIKRVVERIENVSDKSDEQKYTDLYVTGLLWENKDIKTAEKYYLEAAKYKKAAYADIGRMYYRKVNKKKGIEKYEEGWKKGDLESAYELGIIYDQYEKKPDKGEEWLKLAGEKGHSGAQYNLGTIYRDKGKIIESINWYKKSAEQGDKEAQYNLGLIYAERGRILDAEKWWKLAAEQGVVEAENNLGNLCVNKKKNYKEAEYWYKRAVENGSVKALYNLGIMYDENLNNLEEAGYWYKRALENGIKEAEYKLNNIEIR